CVVKKNAAATAAKMNADSVQIFRPKSCRKWATETPASVAVSPCCTNAVSTGGSGSRVRAEGPGPISLGGSIAWLLFPPYVQIPPCRLRPNNDSGYGRACHSGKLLEHIRAESFRRVIRNVKDVVGHEGEVGGLPSQNPTDRNRDFLTIVQAGNNSINVCFL